MIFVTVGGSQFPFDRLLEGCHDVAPGRHVLVQYGPSKVRPAGCECVEYLPMQELMAIVRDAEAVVTHGGVGSILIALSSGKRPIVVPRLRAHGETVDDHQLESARRFAEAGLVELVEDPKALRDAIAAPPEPVSVDGRTPGLVSELRGYLQSVVPTPAR